MTGREKLLHEIGQIVEAKFHPLQEQINLHDETLLRLVGEVGELRGALGRFGSGRNGITVRGSAKTMASFILIIVLGLVGFLAVKNATRADEASKKVDQLIELIWP